MGQRIRAYSLGLQTLNCTALQPDYRRCLFAKLLGTTGKVPSFPWFPSSAQKNVFCGDRWKSQRQRIFHVYPGPLLTVYPWVFLGLFLSPHIALSILLGFFPATSLVRGFP